MKNNRELTFEMLPESMAKLMDDMEQLTVMVKDIQERTGMILSDPVNTFAGHNIMTTAQVCKLLGRTKSTIYRMIARGELPCYKQGKMLVYFEDEIKEWIESGRKMTSEEMMAEARQFIERGTY